MPCPLPAPVGWGLWSFWLAPPRLFRAVCSTKICMVWLLPLVSSNVIVTCSLPYKVALFSLQKGAPVPALMRFILHRPLPLVCVGSFRLCGTAGRSRGGSGSRGHGGWGPGRGRGYHGGGGCGSPGPESIPTCIHTYLQTEGGRQTDRPTDTQADRLARQPHTHRPHTCLLHLHNIGFALLLLFWLLSVSLHFEATLRRSLERKRPGHRMSQF